LIFIDYLYPLGFNFCHFQPSTHISSRFLFGDQFKESIANAFSAITVEQSPSLLLENSKGILRLLTLSNVLKSSKTLVPTPYPRFKLII